MSNAQTKTIKTNDLPVENLFPIVEKSVDGARPLCEMGKLFHNPKTGAYLAHTGPNETLGLSTVAVIKGKIGVKGTLTMGEVLSVSNLSEKDIKASGLKQNIPNSPKFFLNQKSDPALAP